MISQRRRKCSSSSTSASAFANHKCFENASRFSILKLLQANVPGIQTHLETRLGKIHAMKWPLRNELFPESRFMSVIFVFGFPLMFVDFPHTVPFSHVRSPRRSSKTMGEPVPGLSGCHSCRLWRKVSYFPL